MSEKNPEVVGCDASIMKNVWEIRLREHGHKRQQEQKRIEESALPSINKDWSDRILARHHNNYKRVERKAKPADTQTDNKNFLNNKRPQIPPPGLGSQPLGPRGGPRGGPGRGISASVPGYKEKKRQDKKISRLMSITQTQPSAMVWGKSWKYNKCLPPPAEGATAPSDWGQCWMFAKQQPFTEAGQPWKNGPNVMDLPSCQLWEKSVYRVMGSQELDLSLPMEEWHVSWKKAPEQKEGKPDDEDVPKHCMFTLLDDSQKHNEALCSSEWRESWKSTKPPSGQVPSNGPSNGPINISVEHKQDEDGEQTSEWEESWRFINHHLCKESHLQKSNTSEWANSWRAANNQKPDSTPGQSQSNVYDSLGQQQNHHLQKVIVVVSREERCRDLWSSQFGDELKPLSEWNKSWEVTKNNSKPCEEIEKVLNAAPPMMETQLEAHEVEEKPKENYSMSDKTDPRYEQLKYEVIYLPKTKCTDNMLLRLKHLEKALPFTEWGNSWSTVKHRLRLERRRMRPHPSMPFRKLEMGGERRPPAPEWKDSWKSSSHPLRQEAELWQQGWSNVPQSRPIRARDQNHFVVVGAPQNGPTGEQGWGDSWRFFPCQHRSETLQGSGQTGQIRQPENSQQAQRRKSLADWQEAWMVSESDFHHDRPSLTQWMEAWRWSTFNGNHWFELMPQHNWMDTSIEIKPQKEKQNPLQRAKDKMSRSFDCQIFKERYPEEQWSMSWRAESLLSFKPSHHRSPGMPGKSLHSHSQQAHNTTTEPRSEWGRSFRLANPMPPLDQPWAECPANPCHYMVMWSRGRCIRRHLDTNFNKDPTAFRLWGNSYRSVMGLSNKGKSTESHGPLVIMTKKIRMRKHMYTNIEMDKPSERKWTGCHLLGKTQPRTKRSSALFKKPVANTETNDKFFEEWVESWRFFVRPGSLKKQIKSLSGWCESWKFLLPPYSP